MEFNNLFIQMFFFIFFSLTTVIGTVNLIIYYRRKANGEFLKTCEDFVEYNKKAINGKK